MDTLLTTTGWLLVMAGMAVGFIIGYVLNKTTSPEEKQKKKLELELQQSREEFRHYQHQVTEHFLGTSQQFAELTRNYKLLHEHLAQGAMDLASPEISRQMLEAGKSDSQESAGSLVYPGRVPSPPKDYAPKVPGGVLSEHYGLQDETHRSSVSPLTIAGEADDNDDGDPTLKVG